MVRTQGIARCSTFGQQFGELAGPLPADNPETARDRPQQRETESGGLLRRLLQQPASLPAQGIEDLSLQAVVCRESQGMQQHAAREGMIDVAERANGKLVAPRVLMPEAARCRQDRRLVQVSVDPSIRAGELRKIGLDDHPIRELQPHFAVRGWQTRDGIDILKAFEHLDQGEDGLGPARVSGDLRNLPFCPLDVAQYAWIPVGEDLLEGVPQVRERLQRLPGVFARRASCILDGPRDVANQAGIVSHQIGIVRQPGK